MKLLLLLLLISELHCMENKIEEIQSHNVVVNVNTEKSEDGCLVKSNCKDYKVKIAFIISGLSITSTITMLIYHLKNC